MAKTELRAYAMPIGDYIAHKEMTQDQFAKMMGVTQAAVSRWLSSDRDIKVVDFDNGLIEVVEDKVIASNKKTKAA